MKGKVICVRKLAREHAYVSCNIVSSLILL